MVYNIYMYLKHKGAALLETVIAIALFVALFVGFFALIQVGINTVIENRMRTGALAIAQAKIEYIRSLDYDSVGLENGDPIGVVASLEYETLNNTEYTISSDIRWVDDSLDGLIGQGDEYPNDYKIIKIEVSWQESGGITDSVELSSYVADFIPE